MIDKRYQIPNPYDKKPVVITDVDKYYEVEKFAGAICAAESVSEILSEDCPEDISQIYAVLRRYAVRKAKRDALSEKLSEADADARSEKASGTPLRSLIELPDIALAIREVGPAKTMECLRHFDWIEYYPDEILSLTDEISKSRKITDSQAYGLASLWMMLKTELNHDNEADDKNGRIVRRQPTPPEKNKYRDKSGKSTAYVSREVTYYDKKSRSMKTERRGNVQRNQTVSGKVILGIKK